MALPPASFLDVAVGAAPPMIFTWHSPCVRVWVQISPVCKDPSYTACGANPTPHDLFQIRSHSEKLKVKTSAWDFFVGGIQLTRSTSCQPGAFRPRS